MELLETVKVRLGYINADQKTEGMLEDLIDEGKSYIQKFCADLDFEGPTTERALLIDWIRYALSNCTDDFRTNYRDELIALSNRGKVKRHGTTSKTEQRDPVQSGTDPVPASGQEQDHHSE